MTTKPTYFVISNCPLCGQSHKFPIKVIRVSMLFGASPNNPVKEEWCQQRLFTCPGTGKKFEGTVTLKDDPEDRIMAVKVEEALE